MSLTFPGGDLLGLQPIMVVFDLVPVEEAYKLRRIFSLHTPVCTVSARLQTGCLPFLCHDYTFWCGVVQDPFAGLDSKVGELCDWHCVWDFLLQIRYLE